MVTFDKHFDFLIQEFGKKVQLNLEPTHAIITPKSFISSAGYFEDRTFYCKNKLLSGDAVSYQGKYWYAITDPIYEENYSSAVIRKASWSVNFFSQKAKQSGKQPYGIRIPSILKMGNMSTSAYSDGSGYVLNHQLTITTQNQYPLNLIQARGNMQEGEPVILNNLQWEVAGIDKTKPGLITFYLEVSKRQASGNDYNYDIPEGWTAEDLFEADMAHGGGSGDRPFVEPAYIDIINNPKVIKPTRLDIRLYDADGIDITGIYDSSFASKVTCTLKGDSATLERKTELDKPYYLLTPTKDGEVTVDAEYNGFKTSKVFKVYTSEFVSFVFPPEMSAPLKTNSYRTIGLDRVEGVGIPYDVLVNDVSLTESEQGIDWQNDVKVTTNLGVIKPASSMYGIMYYRFTSSTPGTATLTFTYKNKPGENNVITIEVTS